MQAQAGDRIQMLIHTKTTPNTYKNNTKITQKQHQNHTKTTPNTHTNNTKNTQKQNIGAAAAVAMDGQPCMEQGVKVNYSFAKTTVKKVAETIFAKSFALPLSFCFLCSLLRWMGWLSCKEQRVQVNSFFVRIREKGHRIVPTTLTTPTNPTNPTGPTNPIKPTNRTCDNTLIIYTG
jgi:hypothetical protein